jgi:type I site-specific restriction endonuclease
MEGEFYKEKQEGKFYKPKPGERISEADTWVKVIDPHLRESGWRDQDIKRELYAVKNEGVAL